MGQTSDGRLSGATFSNSNSDKQAKADGCVPTFAEQIHKEALALAALGDAATEAQVAVIQAKIAVGMRDLQARGEALAHNTGVLVQRVADSEQTWDAIDERIRLLSGWIALAEGYKRWAIRGWAVAAGLMLALAVVLALLVRTGAPWAR
jgi:hypothetical protein